MVPWTGPSRDSVQAACMKSRQIYTYICFLTFSLLPSSRLLRLPIVAKHKVKHTI